VQPRNTQFNNMVTLMNQQRTSHQLLMYHESTTEDRNMIILQMAHTAISKR